MTRVDDEPASANDVSVGIVTSLDPRLGGFAHADTRILTTRGEIAVDHLTQQDVVVGMRHGRFAPVRRIGCIEVDLRAHPDPDAVSPVRVCAHAFGPARPNRDLLVSPNHALYVDGQLIAVRDLLNGATIRQERWDSIAYYHVELDDHDILLANNMTVESVRDAGDRPACAPFLPKDRPLAALRQTLLDRAAALGHATTADPELRVMAGKRMLRPRPVPGGVRFLLPRGVSRVRIVSRSFMPHEMRAADIDCRRLGVGITSIRLDGRDVELAGDRLGAGWHPAEPGLRWTDGAAWLRTGVARSLVLTRIDDALYWMPPETEATLPAAPETLPQRPVVRTIEERRPASWRRLPRACAAMFSALISLPFRSFHIV
jgi:hypothetical protein